ncbi:hypothetical protein SAMD00019534_024770 [Acytostelium subglobosum LB1]|uniref:hypothetical protein n=1 Tax=Acytostelium subglobosum LB1 TaxID=1410327 RepID=UPI0006449281|nr:hypothetical protein SAMD00019534_024770 [Acytostelium subglobosum LB1]GAM19302.1 hypothetical protein SAMD00019534_024770 [Acytostelium subglobosum LB1]|eukprot:XP_012757229.1 hypothetical protein SAMD00019534_024770 [Acytostelium subglobosum LB1]
MMVSDRDTGCISQVFHNHLLVNIIIGHVIDIHKRWMSLPKPSIRSSMPDDNNNNNNNNIPLIRSTIKGRQLHNMSLVDMLRFNATDMFIKTFDSIASDYPIECNTLLSSAATYNNTMVYNHLINSNSRMKIRIGFIEWDMIFLHSNMDPLRTLLPMSTKFSSFHILRNLLYAVDSGNVEFVRLLLQHTYDANQKQSIAETTGIKLRRPGVRVDMLRMLHKEFKCLYAFSYLWEGALMHSAKYSMLDSVQYIINNMPPHLEVTTGMLIKCLKQCAKSGNIDMFQTFIKLPVGTRYLFYQSNRDIKRIIEKAVDHGQESFINHLHQQYVGRYYINKSCESLIRNLLVMPPPGEPTHTARLRIKSLSSVILNDDLTSIDLCIDQTINLKLKMCRTMSKSIARFISGPRTRVNRLCFGGKSILFMCEAVGRRGSSITTDMVFQFIVNGDHQSPEDLETAMELASGYSTAVMKQLHTHFNIEYNNSKCLKKAMSFRCFETISLILNHPGDKSYLEKDRNVIRDEAFMFVSKAPLSEVTFILDHIDFVRGDVELCQWAARSPHVDMFEHVINLFTLEQLNDQVINSIINQALLNDRVDNVCMLQQRFENDQTISLIRPTLDTLHIMAQMNCYLTLEHYFNSTSFIDQFKLPLQRERILHFVLKFGYKYSTHRVINLCTDQIKSSTTT